MRITAHPNNSVKDFVLEKGSWLGVPSLIIKALFSIPLARTGLSLGSKKIPPLQCHLALVRTGYLHAE